MLEVHLAMLKRSGAVTTWHDRRILVGDDFGQTIDENLEAAAVILLLVSPDFLASQYCYDREMTRALERAHADQARVIPVILRPCDWNDAPFGKLLASPTDGKPITMWPDRDEAFLDVVKHIKAALRTYGPARTDPASKSRPATRGPVSRARSSNLRVAKVFTDHDRNTFLRETFEYIVLYFTNSLDELGRREPNITSDHLRVDANRFQASLYNHGATASQCSVFIGGMPSSSNGIAYSNSLMASGFNEMLYVESAEHELFLKPMGMLQFGQRLERRLSMEGAAELYWSAFIETVQTRRR